MTFGVAFTSSFLYSVVLFTHFPDVSKQRLSSFVRCVVLSSTVASSLLGQAMVGWTGTGSASPAVTTGRLHATVAVSVAATACSAVTAGAAISFFSWRRRARSKITGVRVVPIAAAAAPLLPPEIFSSDVSGGSAGGGHAPLPQQRLPPACLATGYIGRVVAWVVSVVIKLRTGRVALWSVLGACVLGVHTIVLTDWQSLFDAETTSRSVGNAADRVAVGVGRGVVWRGVCWGWCGSITGSASLWVVTVAEWTLAPSWWGRAVSSASQPPFRCRMLVSRLPTRCCRCCVFDRPACVRVFSHRLLDVCVCPSVHLCT